jgi:predicted ester cyclase
MMATIVPRPGAVRRSAIHATICRTLTGHCAPCGKICAAIVTQPWQNLPTKASRWKSIVKEAHMQSEMPAAVNPVQGLSGMTRDEIVAFFERREELYDDLDAAGLAADYTDDAVIESPMAGVHRGPPAAEHTLKAAFSAFLDRTMKTEALIIDGDRVAQALAVEGTHIGEFMGLPPTGKSFRFHAVFLYELRNRKIVHERRIYDFTGLLMQIGVLKAKPI